MFQKYISVGNMYCGLDLIQSMLLWMLLILYAFAVLSHVFSAAFHKAMQNLWVAMYQHIWKAKRQCDSKDQRTCHLAEENTSGKFVFSFLNIARLNKTFQIQTGFYFQVICIVFYLQKSCFFWWQGHPKPWIKINLKQESLNIMKNLCLF